MIETLVAIGIIGLMLGILIPAAMKVRALAARVQCFNNHRQTVLSFHHYATDREGSLPYFKNGTPPPLFAILPYMEQQDFFYKYVAGQLNSKSPFPSKYLLCPADPTLFDAITDQRTQMGWTSVAVNWQVFQLPGNINNSIPDGLSTTLCTAEHYTKCRSACFSYTAREYNPFNPASLPVFAVS